MRDQRIKQKWPSGCGVVFRHQTAILQNVRFNSNALHNDGFVTSWAQGYTFLV